MLSNRAKTIISWTQRFFGFCQQTTRRCPNTCLTACREITVTSSKTGQKTNHHLTLAQRCFGAKNYQTWSNIYGTYLSLFHQPSSSSSWKATAKFVCAIKKLINQFNTNRITSIFDFNANLCLIFKIQPFIWELNNNTSMMTRVYYFMLDKAFRLEPFPKSCLSWSMKFCK